MSRPQLFRVHEAPTSSAGWWGRAIEWSSVASRPDEIVYLLLQVEKRTGLSRARLANRIGVEKGTLYRFMARESRSMHPKRIDAVVKFLKWIDEKISVTDSGSVDLDFLAILPERAEGSGRNITVNVDDIAFQPLVTQLVRDLPALESVIHNLSFEDLVALYASVAARKRPRHTSKQSRDC